MGGGIIMSRYELLDDAPTGRYELLDDAPTPAKPKKGSGIPQGIGNLLAGALRGAGSIGATIIAPGDMINDALMGKGLSLESNRKRRADMDAGFESMGADPSSMFYKGGKLGAEIAGTAGAGGVLANSLRAVAPGAIAASPTAAKLVQALSSSGFRTGSPAATTIGGKLADIGVRMAGGAVTGGASAGLVNPDDAGTGAVIGGVLPPALTTVGSIGGYAGNAIKSLVQPFTAKGQEAIKNKILLKFAEGGPTSINNSVLVPGSIPTLAEATGNAGLATLQRGARDIRPNAFVEREGLNAAARNALYDDVAGDAQKLAFFKADRATVADELYKKALDPANMQAPTPYVKGQITQLMKRPSIQIARKEAQKLAMERGERPSFDGSLPALHDIKTIIDDQIGEAVRAGKGGQAQALGKTKDKLLDVMGKLSPGYDEAMTTYANMSQPINAMESLQGLRLTDAQGNITLSKIKGAIEGLERLRAKAGVQAAKSVTDNQLEALRSIQADLLRQSNIGAGRSIGSKLQNLSTNNIIESVLPGRLGDFVKDKAGGVLGQIGKLSYSGSNEAIQNKLIDSLLDPQLAQYAFNPATQQLGAGFNSLNNTFSPFLYRSAPLLGGNR
jgi:hypothetical protein